MSDAVQVAIIAGVFNVLAIIASRLLSHQEHKNTAAQVEEIRVAVNGKNH